MAITTMAGINAALPGQIATFFKTAFTPLVGNWYSPWLLNGTSPATGSAPSSGLAGDVPTKATTGAPSFTNPASGNTYVGHARSSMIYAASRAVLIGLYDRLWHNSGIDATITTGQTINSVALTRPDANGSAAEAWWEVYVATGAGTPTVTLSYTDQSGNAGNSASSGALTASMAAGRAGTFTLAAGDTGVRSIQTWTADATFTSGTIGLVIRRCVTTFHLPLFPSPAEVDALALGLPRVYDDACLEMLVYANSAGASVVGPTSFNLIQG